MISSGSGQKQKSTNGRKKAPAPLRVGLSALATISAPAASRLAQRFFFMPRRYDRPARETDLLASAERFQFIAGHRVLEAWTWGSGPVIALMHGWEGRGAQLGAVAQPLVERGYRVVAFDAPAHGDSPGRTASPVAFADALAALDRWVGGLYGVVAHSLGTVATSIAVKRGLAVERLVFIAPGYSPTQASRRFAGFFDIDDSILQKMRRDIAKNVGMTWGEIDRLSSAHGLSHPVLIVHDTDDKDVSVENAREIAEGWNGAQLMLTEKLGHRRILRDAAVVDRVKNFFPEQQQSQHTNPWKEFLHTDSDFGFDLDWRP